MVVMVAFFISMVVMVAVFISMVVMGAFLLGVVVVSVVGECDVVRHVFSVDFNIISVFFFIDKLYGFVWPF